MADEEDDNTIRLRLVMKETALKKVAKRFMSFCNNIENASLEECNVQYQLILKELALFEFGIEKARMICDTTEREMSTYNQLFAQREQSIEDVKQEITMLKEQLTQERIIRQNKEQYTQLAKIIAERPPTSVTEKEIEQLQGELDVLTQEATRVNLKIDLRTKQFQLFLHALSELQKDLDDEEESPPDVKDVDMSEAAT